jgi:hypothetical protein
MHTNDNGGVSLNGLDVGETKNTRGEGIEDRGGLFRAFRVVTKSLEEAINCRILRDPLHTFNKGDSGAWVRALKIIVVSWELKNNLSSFWNLMS